MTVIKEADGELLAEFLNESQEHLQNIEQGVLVLEENPADADTLNSIFRAFHTFKGGAGFLNLTAIKDLAHELESLLDAARQHRLTVTSPIIDVILEGGDTLKIFVAQITTRLSGEADGVICVPTRALIQRVQAILTNPDATPAPTRPAPPEPVAQTASVSPSAEATAPAPITVLKPDAPAAKASTSGPSGDAAAAFVKVDTLKLDSLIEIVGELVIAQSMVVQDPGVRELVSQELTRNLAQLRRTTNDLQRTAMSLRMVPIRGTFQKMTRLVRDLAAKQKKQVRLVMNGEDTELDRTIVGIAAINLVGGASNLWTVKTLSGNVSNIAGQSVPELRASMNADMQHDCARAAIYRAAIGNLVKITMKSPRGTREFQEATRGLRADLDELARLPIGKEARTALAPMQAAPPEYVIAGEAVIATFQKKRKQRRVPRHAEKLPGRFRNGRR